MTDNKPKPLPHLTPDDIKEFARCVPVAPLNKCWHWNGPYFRKGYGRFRVGNRALKAHRISYFLAHNEDPFPLLVLHTCDNPPCVNPKHLFLGTNKDNADDMMKKNRHARCGPKNPARGDRNGARLYPERLARGDQNPSRLHPEKLARGEKSGMNTHPEKRSPGSKNGNSKLNEDAVREIRQLYRSGNWTLCLLASQFKVGKSIISLIVRNEIWKHVTE